MPELIVCSRCGQPVPETAPAAQCPSCLLRLGLASTGRPDDTPLTARTYDSPTKDYAGQHATRDGVGLEHATVTADGAEGRTTAPGGPVLAGRTVQFGNYELREELGRGGMGVVFRAIQAVAGREVAVKVLLGGVAGEALHGGRFTAEVSALAQLRHPNIVTVYEVGEVNGSAFFSMEYAPNGTLAARLKSGPLPLTEVAELVGKLAEATEAAHQLGVLHRDIKPGNVLIAADGEPKLSDFGLAKWFHRDEALTASGAAMGTPAYMPPEQARDAKVVGPTADVYSLGATLYECLTGRPPFRGPDAYVIIQRVLAQEPDAPRSIRADIPADLEAVCLKCLDKDPTKRYASAQALAADLTRWRAGESTIARPLTRTQRVWRRVRRRWKTLAAALFLALGGGGLAFGLVWMDPQRQVDRAMRSGDRVELIGPTGPPKWSRWVIPGEANAQPNQVFEVASPDSTVLELAAESPHSHYRITVELRPTASYGENSWSGIYFAHNRPIESASGNGIVERVILVKQRRDLMSVTPLVPNGDPVEFQDAVIIQQDGKTTIEPAMPRGAHYNADPREHERDRPWWAFEAEVTPDTIRVKWRDQAGTWHPVGVPERNGPPRVAVPVSELRQDTPHLTELMTLGLPGLTVRRLEYQPQGALGLFVYRARVLFRNFVYEPVHDGPNP